MLPRQLRRVRGVGHAFGAWVMNVVACTIKIQTFVYCELCTLLLTSQALASKFPL